MTGLWPMVYFVTFAATATYVTYAKVLRADLEIMGLDGQIDCFKEGALPALALFFLTWTIVYTFAQP